jgi:SEC-C motif domain protein
MEQNTHCHCGNQIPFDQCCQPFIEEKSLPETAEQLLRSRYSAYVIKNSDYVAKTDVQPNLKSIEDWMRASQFTELRVGEIRGGGKDDSQGTIVFEADYTANEHKHLHRETSQFEKRDGRWMFLYGKQNPTRAEKTPGRNDPCMCGSNKKYKKCCGA